MFKIIDGTPYRERRGKMVEIPRKWLHNITTRSTIADRKKAAIVKWKGRKKTYKWQKQEPITEK